MLLEGYSGRSHSEQVFNADLKEFDKQKIASSKDFDANTGEAKKGLLVLGGSIVFGILCAALAALTGDAEDLLFILYFETFPEHWHGNYSLVDLLSRVPSFYGLWLMYTGGALLLIVPFLFGSSVQAERKSLHVILGATFAYSLLLATIDHHPSHYFLPLVALTAPCLVLSSSLLPTASGRKLLLYLGLLGVGIYLWNGVV